MGRIDTSRWGEFRLGKLFNLKTGETKGIGLFNIVNSVAYHGKDIEEIAENSPNGLNYVTRSKFNNGIKCKVLKKDSYTINPAGTISFGAENADFFYQTEEYITGNKMYYIDTSELSKYSCAFIKSILEATFTASYSFSDGMIPARIYDEAIKLPIDSEGNPDWAYMESYMRNIEVSVSDSLSKLASAKDVEKSKIDISGWGEFKISDVCCALKGRNKLSNINISDIGTVPVYSSTTENNGILGYTEENADYSVGITTPFYIIFGDHTKAMHIASEDFCVMDNVKVLIPNIFNKHIVQFILTAWRGVIPDLGYSRHWSIAEKVTIKLPTDEKGNPDWAYMESYMKSLELKVKGFLDKVI